MKRIYADSIVKPNDENCNEYFLQLANKQKEIKEKFKDEENIRKKVIVYFHNHIREGLELPNKLFGFATSKDNTKACIVLFDKESDGNVYDVFFDDELKQPYILVDENEEESDQCGVHTNEQLTNA